MPPPSESKGENSKKKRARRRRWIVLIPCLIIFAYVMTRLSANRNAVQIRNVEIVGQRQPAFFEGTIRFAAFNIAHGRGTNASNWSARAGRRSRIKEIANLLAREKVDIAVLNEVDFDAVWTLHGNQAEAIAREAGFQHVVEQRNLDVAIPFVRLRFGNAVLSRFPIRSARSIQYPSASSYERRFAGSKQGAIVDVQLDDQTVIRVIPVHLEHRDPATRAGSIEVIAAAAKESPVPFFCLGDFNCGIMNVRESRSSGVDNETFDRLLPESQLKRFRTPPLDSKQLTFSSFSPTLAIDWVWIPVDWEFVSLRVMDVQLSDHRPLFAEVRLRK
jgi:endonuclease/exonuclease/phosphatase family metal-dependent hydrolase